MVERVPWSEEHPLSRVSIAVTPEQHQRLQAMAALAGKTIQAYMLAQALPPVPDRKSLSAAEARRQLEAFWKPRLEEAERGEVVNQSVTAIIDALQQERRARSV